MPLVYGSSKKEIKENIRRLIAEGKSTEQAIAIAYALAGKKRK